MSERVALLVVGELIADAVLDSEDSDSSSLASRDPTDLRRSATGTSASTSNDALVLRVRPGGSPANVAVGLARLGVAVGFAGRLSLSSLGRWLNSYLTKNGVDLGFSVSASEAPTLAIVALNAEGIASYDFYGRDTADWQWRREELPPADRLSVKAVHTGSLAVAAAPGAEAVVSWIRDVRTRGSVLVSYDPNVRPSRIADTSAFTDRARSLVGQSHLVKVSEGDLALMYPEDDAIAVARSWVRNGPEIVVLTRGPREALAFRPDGSCVVGPKPSGPVVDTVGAGDAFSSGLLPWLAEADALHPGGLMALGPEALRCALDIAGRVASANCARFGSDPPHRQEVSDGPWPAVTDHREVSST